MALTLPSSVKGLLLKPKFLLAAGAALFLAYQVGWDMLLRQELEAQDQVGAEIEQIKQQQADEERRYQALSTLEASVKTLPVAMASIGAAESPQVLTYSMIETLTTLAATTPYGPVSLSEASPQEPLEVDLSKETIPASLKPTLPTDRPLPPTLIISERLTLRADGHLLALLSWLQTLLGYNPLIVVNGVRLTLNENQQPVELYLPPRPASPAAEETPEEDNPVSQALSSLAASFTQRNEQAGGTGQPWDKQAPVTMTVDISILFDEEAANSPATPPTDEAATPELPTEDPSAANGP